MTEKKAPGPRNQQLIAEAQARFAERPVRASVKFEFRDDGHPVAGAPHSDELGNHAAMLDAFGTTSSEFYSGILGQLETATRHRGARRGARSTELNTSLAIVQAIAPQDELEAALATQMASCHALTMEMLGRAKGTDNTEHLVAYGNLAVKLQRTFTTQLEALGRMRGKGQQTVRVEHVTVAEGAQAIIGDVHHHPRGRGANKKREGQPREKQAASRPERGTALPGPQPQGHAVPVPSDEERPVPASRRTVDRRTKR